MSVVNDFSMLAVVEVSNFELWTRFLHKHCDCIGVDFGGQPGHMPPNNWEMPMHLSLFTIFCPQLFWFAHPIFLTSLRQIKRHEGRLGLVLGLV